MFDDTPGGQTLTILKRAGTPVKDANGITIPGDDTPVVVEGCLAEMQRGEEAVGLTTTNGELGWFFLPVNDDTRAITTRDAISFDDRTFEMRGPRVIEYDLRSVHFTAGVHAPLAHRGSC